MALIIELIEAVVLLFLYNPLHSILSSSMLLLYSCSCDPMLTRQTFGNVLIIIHFDIFFNSDVNTKFDVTSNIGFSIGCGIKTGPGWIIVDGWWG
jgi:hypothetical protein